MTTVSGYEFTDRENETFRGLVRGMKRTGAAVAAGSLVQLAYQLAVYFEVSLVKADSKSKLLGALDVGIWCVLSVVGVIVAVLLVRATRGFFAVIHTEGDDIKHLMDGLQKLRSIVDLIFWAALVGSGLLSISFVLLLTGHT